jgi:hypothetical protein
MMRSLPGPRPMENLEALMEWVSVLPSPFVIDKKVHCRLLVLHQPNPVVRAAISARL